jgi:DNA-binding YbaB/EbfC family protein
MGSGFSKMKKQARMMQEQFGQMKENLQKTEVVGSAGNGLVTVTLNGEKDLKKVSIKPECLTDAEGLQDLLLAAFEDAASKLDKAEKSLQPQMPFFS